jgi:hypothetical protein
MSKQQAAQQPIGAILDAQPASQVLDAHPPATPTRPAKLSQAIGVRRRRALGLVLALRDRGQMRRDRLATMTPDGRCDRLRFGLVERGDLHALERGQKDRPTGITGCKLSRSRLLVQFSKLGSQRSASSLDRR